MGYIGPFLDSVTKVLGIQDPWTKWDYENSISTCTMPLPTVWTIVNDKIYRIITRLPLCSMSRQSHHLWVQLELFHCHSFADSSPIALQASLSIPYSLSDISIFPSTKGKGTHRLQYATR